MAIGNYWPSFMYLLEMLTCCAHLESKSNTSGRMSPLLRLIVCFFILFRSVLLFSCLKDENKLLGLCSHLKKIWKSESLIALPYTKRNIKWDSTFTAVWEAVSGKLIERLENGLVSLGLCSLELESSGDPLAWRDIKRNIFLFVSSGGWIEEIGWH